MEISRNKTNMFIIVYSIAKALGKLDPVNAKYFSKNAFLYAKKLRSLKRNIQNILINSPRVFSFVLKFTNWREAMLQLNNMHKEGRE